MKEQLSPQALHAIAQMNADWRLHRASPQPQPQRFAIPVPYQPQGVISLIGKATIEGRSNCWRYEVDVLANPFALEVSPTPTPLATAKRAYNGLELGNTSSSVWGEPIVTTSPECGDIIGVKDCHTSFAGYPIPAILAWTWFEEGAVEDGQYAWWFWIQNMLNIKDEE